MVASLADSDVADATQFRAAVARALCELPGDILRELATRWPANGNFADRIVAEAIAEALNGPSVAQRTGRQDQPPWLRRQNRHMQARAAASSTTSPSAVYLSPASRLDHRRHPEPGILGLGHEAAQGFGEFVTGHGCGVPKRP